MSTPNAESVRVYALYSPCCGVLRLGLDWPEGSMHSGLCRQAHGGDLGPTIRLSGEYRPEQSDGPQRTWDTDPRNPDAECYRNLNDGYGAAE